MSKGYACVLSHFSCIWFCVTLWTIACQAPLSLRFSRQEYWSRLPCPPPGDLPNPRLLCFLQWEAGSLLAPPGKPEWRPEMLFAHSTMYTPALHRKNYSASNGHLDEVKKLCPPWTYTERRDHVQKKNIFCLWITGSGQRNRTLLKWSLERHAYLKYCLLVIVWMFDLVTLTI